MKENIYNILTPNLLDPELVIFSVQRRMYLVFLAEGRTTCAALV